MCNFLKHFFYCQVPKAIKVSKHHALCGLGGPRGRHRFFKGRFGGLGSEVMISPLGNVKGGKPQLIHPRSLTARPSKIVVGRILCYWVSVTFQGRTVKLQTGIQSWGDSIFNLVTRFWGETFFVLT